MDDEKGKFQFSGLRFLYEMELIDDPQLINNLKLNIFDVSKMILDAEFVSSYHHRSMLIWVELDWLGRTFFKERITTAVADRVQQLLPKFKLRVVSDRAILEMSLNKIKEAMQVVTPSITKSLVEGDNNEKVSSVSDVDLNSHVGTSGTKLSK